VIDIITGNQSSLMLGEAYTERLRGEVSNHIRRYFERGSRRWVYS